MALPTGLEEANTSFYLCRTAVFKFDRPALLFMLSGKTIQQLFSGMTAGVAP